MSDEYELKLAVSPDTLRRLRRHPLLRSLASGRGANKTLTTTYYDTPERHLAARGLALRVREDGRTRVQCLKSEGDRSGLLKHFNEDESELGTEQLGPDLSLLHDGALKSELIAIAEGAGIEPVFTTSIQRYAVPLRFADSDLELALDSGAVRAGDQEEKICEAEIELKSGSPQRVLELALCLQRDSVFRVERRTKAERGYALSLGHVPQAVFSTRAGISADTRLDEALVAFARNAWSQVRANEAAALAGHDIEGVHQFRVGLRRLRAVLKLMKPYVDEELLAQLENELRWLHGEASPARALDVLISETLRPMQAEVLALGLGDLSGCIASLENARLIAYRDLSQALHTPRYAGLNLKLALWLGAPFTQTKAVEEETMGSFGRSVLTRQHKKVAKLARADKDDVEAWHDLRVVLKKLRYSAEFFHKAAPAKSAKAYVAHLKKLQDLLGLLNDVAEVPQILERASVGLAPRDLALIQGWQTARAAKVRSKIPVALKSFRRSRFF